MNYPAYLVTLTDEELSNKLSGFLNDNDIKTHAKERELAGLQSVKPLPFYISDILIEYLRRHSKSHQIRKII